MKIRQLNFTAFGPFTNKLLDFDSLSQDTGLHIIYGANEAGKSSALRALKAFLYGIEPRTSDNFIHAHDRLRIQGSLQMHNGNRLEFVRRKGNKNTLLTIDGDILEDEKLNHFLQGVSPELFNSLFGIDHQALLKGGQEILAQKGEVGQTLFSAALGSHVLHSVLDNLDKEADALFKSRGSKQTINAAIKAHTELKKEISHNSLSSVKWHEQQHLLEKIGSQLEQLKAELADKRTEINRLKRIQRVLPKLTRRNEFLHEFSKLKNIVPLADDFQARHQTSLRTLDAAQVLVDKTGPKLKNLHKQLEGLSVNQALLLQAEKIEDLYARLDSYNKSLQESPQLKTQRKQKINASEFLLKVIKPELKLKDIENLRPVLAQRQQINELGSEFKVLKSQLKQATENLKETENKLDQSRQEQAELSEFKAPDALQRSIILCRKLGDIDTIIYNKQSEFNSLQQQCVTRLSRLTLLRMDENRAIDAQLTTLPVLKVPKRESIIQFEKKYSDLDKQQQAIKDKQQSGKQTLYDTTLRLDELQRAGNIPSENELNSIRAERESLWQLIRRQWLEAEDISCEIKLFSSGEILPEKFEQKVASADEISDRLRREAERVTKVANYQAIEKSIATQLDELSKALTEYSLKKKSLESQWQALWQPADILPDTPQVMKAWLDDFHNLREQIEVLSIIKQSINELQTNRNKQIQLLTNELKLLGIDLSKKDISGSNTLEPILLECEDILAQLIETSQNHKLLNNDIKNHEKALSQFSDEYKAAEQQLKNWKSLWQDLLKAVGLPKKSSPADMLDIIEQVRELFDNQNDAEKLKIKIQAIKEDVQRFNDMVLSLTSSIAPQLTNLAIDDMILQLNKLLSDNRARQIKREQIETQIEQAQDELQECSTIIQSMKETLDHLCSEAQCRTHAQLDEAEILSKQYFRTQKAIDSIEQEILESGEGLTIAELISEASEVDPDVLPVRLEELINIINDELEPERTALAESRGRQEKELELMDGSDKAAALAEESQAMLASIRGSAEDYVRVKLAARILRDQIERYRNENQGPLIKRASEHFAQLTLNSFSGLVTDFNEKDEPILTGVRPNGGNVPVEGMSAGTRDQLYLALRLASLEKYMESAEPMPFIVDDILVDFDDSRSQAALNALLVLAEKTQVILFTHHSRCVEQAQNLQSSGSIKIHNL